MKKNKYIIWLNAFIIIITGTTIISCTDSYFDPEIGGRITPDQHYKSLDDVEKSYQGCFAYLQDVAENQVLFDGLRSDYMDITDNADADMIDIYMQQFSTNNKYIDLSDYYKIVVNVNELLPYLPEVMEKDRYFDSLKYEKYSTDLVSLRAWAYFNIAKLTKEVAIVSTDDPHASPQVFTKAQAIDYLIGELEPYYDEEDIVRFEEGDEHFKIRRSIDLYVLLGELYLEKGDYAKAAEYLKFAVDGPGIFSRTNTLYMVTKDYDQENWATLFINSAYHTSQVRTAIQYSFQEGQRNNLEEWFDINFKYMVKPASPIILAYLNDGEKGDVFRGISIGSKSIEDNMHYYIRKYSFDTDVAHGADVILYRGADIHLLLAEALNRNGQSDIALALLNTGIKGASPKPEGFSAWTKNIGVRGRAYLDPVTAVGVEAIEDLIIEERFKELSFEGKRWFDLVRIAERRNDPSYIADKIAAKFDDPTIKAEVREKLMNPQNWYIAPPSLN